jgi:hypothetical protein
MRSLLIVVVRQLVIVAVHDEINPPTARRLRASAA